MSRVCCSCCHVPCTCPVDTRFWSAGSLADLQQQRAAHSKHKSIADSACTRGIPVPATAAARMWLRRLKQSQCSCFERGSMEAEEVLVPGGERMFTAAGGVLRLLSASSRRELLRRRGETTGSACLRLLPPAPRRNQEEERREGLRRLQAAQFPFLRTSIISSHPCKMCYRAVCAHV